MSAESEDLFLVIARVKRAMPRNADVMRICEFAEEAMKVTGRTAAPEGVKDSERANRPKRRTK